MNDTNPVPSPTEEERQIIIHGDNRTILPLIPDNTYDTLITDPPYGISFQNRAWDYNVPSVACWQSCLRVLKPGGTALVFAGARTQHRMACNLEDAGFILVDCLLWVYNSGFPKGSDIAHGLHKSLGIKRPTLSTKSVPILADGWHSIGVGSQRKKLTPITLPSSPLAQLWDGWRSHSLKPAYEPILLAIKPNEQSYVHNATKWLVSGLNIGGCLDFAQRLLDDTPSKDKARYPANVMVDPEIDDPAETWQRFFYYPKASREERGANNTHPTVKPLDLMAHLVRLTKTPTGGSVIDPFAGSGTTGVACKLEDRYFLGIEFEEEFVEIARSRIATAEQ